MIDSNYRHHRNNSFLQSIAVVYLLCAKLKHLPRNPWVPTPAS